MLTRYQRNRLLLIAAAAVSYALFWFAGAWLGVPRHRDFEASLALQPKSAAVLLGVGCVLAASVALATAVTSTVRFDAGLFASCVGLMALSVRGGPMRYVFQAAGGRDVFLSMALELVALYAFLGLAWLGLWLLHRGGALAGDALRDGLADQEHTHAERLTALAIQTGATAALMLFFARVDDKKQVLAAVWVSSFVATLLAYTFAPVRPSVWFWAGPLLVGVVGYLAGYMNWGRGGPSLWKAGFGAGPLAALARPLPLDYASLGPAAAILGYWVSRGWERAKEIETGDDRDAAAPAPL
jgi:hypothetical protein